MTTAVASHRPPMADPRLRPDRQANRGMAVTGTVTAQAPAQRVAGAIHDARRRRQAGDLDEALSILAGMDLARAATPDARWAYAEWLDVARRRVGEHPAWLYRPGTGRAAALAPRTDGALQVVAVLGMRWPLGKVVSRRSLRGLKPLRSGAP